MYIFPHLIFWVQQILVLKSSLMERTLPFSQDVEQWAQIREPLSQFPKHVILCTDEPIIHYWLVFLTTIKNRYKHRTHARSKRFLFTVPQYPNIPTMIDLSWNVDHETGLLILGEKIVFTQGSSMEGWQLKAVSKGWENKSFSSEEEPDRCVTASTTVRKKTKPSGTHWDSFH